MLALPNGFFTSAIKKMLAVAFTRCEQAWIVDSESVAFRPFSFTTIFKDYWSDPVVFYLGPALGHRQGFLHNQTAALLGLPVSATGGGGASSHGPLYRHNDYWHFDTSLMRAALDRAVRVAGGGISFTEAFMRSPSHELIYYAYVHFAARDDSTLPMERPYGRFYGHRFVPAAPIVQSLYKARGYNRVPRPTAANRVNCTGDSLKDYLDSLPPVALACRALSAFGQHALRFPMHSAFHPCFSAKPGTTFLHRVRPVACVDASLANSTQLTGR